MEFIDIHTHILPGLDDGAGSLPEALEMLQNAYAGNITALVLTPHCNVPGIWDNYRDRSLLEQFEQLRNRASAIPVRLALGAEVHVTRQLPQLLQQRRIPTLNNSRYLLTEFPARCEEPAFIPMLQSILQEGYVPLLAHPERYYAVMRNPGIVRPWLDLGCHLQLTGGSIMGSFGKDVKNAAEYLLRNDLVCCVASDAHDTKRRTGFLSHVYDHLSLYYSKSYANTLLRDDPMRICLNEKL